MNEQNSIYPAVNGDPKDVIIYHSKDGKIAVAPMTSDGNVWLSQLDITIQVNDVR